MEKDVRKDKKFGVQFAYILDAIDPEGYDGTMPTTDAERVKFVLDTFNEEVNCEWNKRQYPRLSDRIEQYFRGLPSVIHIEFRDYYIAEIGKSWGYDRAVKNGSFVDNWFHRCAERLLQLARKFDIDTTYLG